MATTTVEPGAMLKEKAAEMVKQATAFAARAAEKLEDQVPDVQRAVRKTRRTYEDARDEVIHEIKTHPARSMGLALAAGVAIGWIVGAARAGARTRRVAREVCAEIEADITPV